MVSFLHMVDPFWKSIRIKIQEILGIKVPFTVEVLLLCDFQAWKQGMEFGDMISHLLCAASLIVVGAWNNPVTPSLCKWDTNAGFIFLMAKLSAMVKFRNGFPQATQKFRTQWTPLIKYINCY